MYMVPGYLQNEGLYEIALLFCKSKNLLNEYDIIKKGEKLRQFNKRTLFSFIEEYVETEDISKYFQDQFTKICK